MQQFPSTESRPHGAPAPEQQGNDVALKQLVQQLSHDGSKLIRSEVELAKRELADKATQLKREAMVMATASITLYIGVLTLVAAAVLALALAVAAWVSALVIGGAIALAGAVMLVWGRQKLRELELAPRRTIEAVRRDIDTVKEAAHGP